MIDVPLQGEDLLNVILFLLLVLLELERSASDFLLRVLDLREEVLILDRDSLDSVLKSFNLEA